MNRLEIASRFLSQEIPETLIERKLSRWPLVEKSPELLTALVAAQVAGKMLKKAFYSSFETFVKEDQSEFTPFDVRAERIARRIIEKRFPQAVIMGEEISPDEDITGKNFWVIDGIDGTTNFSRKIPLCNFTMAYVENGRVKTGVVNDFLRDKVYFTLEGNGAFVNGQPIHVMEKPFKKCLTSFAPLLNVRKGKGEFEEELVFALWNGMKKIAEDSGRFPRELQSGGLELAWVASGVLDGYASSWTNPWDLSAGVLLVREAGGPVTNILGQEWQPSFWGVIAGTKTVQPEMLGRIQPFFLEAIRKRPQPPSFLAS